MLSWAGERLRRYANKDGRGYPDWAMRYVPVVRKLGGLKQPGVVLEVGGNENGLARFADVSPVVVDVAMEHLLAARVTQCIAPVVADITALPFRDESIDVCVSMDTFEHLEEGQRRRALAELTRVTAPGARVAIGFPSGEASAAAEANIREAYRAYTGKEFRWLAEHVDQGLPDAWALEASARELFGAGSAVQRSKNANLLIWTWMWRVLICGWPGRGNALFQALLRALTPVLTRCHFGRCYRCVLWIEKRHG